MPADGAVDEMTQTLRCDMRIICVVVEDRCNEVAFVQRAGWRRDDSANAWRKR